MLWPLVWLLVACTGFWASIAGATQTTVPDTPTLSAAEGQALAAKNQCLGCHQVDSRRVGPPFRAVARRYGGQRQAAQYLAQVMRRGSSGQWGAIPMPAQVRLSPQDARSLAQWILSLSQH
ncbi:c-type cytochrome [Castellaniella sp.]|uniref:c-type cytochrome n=1 Tax=Castellaniella sp. TaxID=1955812 RepID=UPI0025BE3B15|nr:c-type cytochrome [Castellaniella sp.]